MERWFQGLDSLYPPYEYGLENVLSEIKKSEKKNQENLVDDIANLFNNNIKVQKDLYLDSRSPKAGYPKDNKIGGYDVLAIDTHSKVIWNIECKFFQRVGSISEFAKHQNSFFKQDKDVMFNKRINYLSENYKKILRSFNISDKSEYKIESHMVTNKLFIPYVKTVSFSCITYSELKDKLKIYKFKIYLKLLLSVL